MGLIDQIFGWVFGGNRNAVVEVAEVFRENAEAGAIRAADIQTTAMTQFAAEFTNPQKGLFDRFMDGVNRVPRPALALGTLALFLAAMFDPAWFAARMIGLSTVPEPLWWLLGAIVSFYFGARHQSKGQDFQRSLAQVVKPIQTVTAEEPVLIQLEKTASLSGNAAVDDWNRWRGHKVS